VEICLGCKAANAALISVSVRAGVCNDGGVAAARAALDEAASGVDLGALDPVCEDLEGTFAGGFVVRVDSDPVDRVDPDEDVE